MQQVAKTKELVIVCVDDEPTVLSTLEIEIQKALGNEFLIEVAENGQEALELIEELLERQQDVVLVIADYIMPHIKGDVLLEKIHQRCPSTFKIMLTGQADIDGVSNAINKADLNHFIAKPWNPEVLQKVIKDAVSEYLKNRLISEQHLRLQELSRLKDDFLAKTSHELRTPLNGIVGCIEILQMDLANRLDKEQAELLETILHSSNRLTNLVEDLLDFSALKNDKLKLKLKPILLAPIIRKVLLMHRAFLQDQTVELKQEIPQNLPLLYADPSRLEQIIFNLVSNAVKFTHQGYIRVTAECIDAQGAVCDCQQAEQIAIHVADTGIGIPAHKFEQIFESFEQVDGSITRSYQGAGLGLSITRELVLQQNGTIQVRSELKRGSCFTITLPIAKEATIEHKVDCLQAEEAQSHFLQRLTVPNEKLNHAEQQILIVDDDVVHLHILKRFLSGANYQTIEFRSALQALHYLDQQAIAKGKAPSLILIDLMMPEMNGYDLIRKIRQHHHVLKIPIIVVSGRTLSADFIASLQVGANDYLRKPVQRDELLARIETHLTIREKYQQDCVYSD